MKKRSRWLFLILAFVMAVQLAPMALAGEFEEGYVMANYFVSPDGNDANQGSEAQPFKTIQQARDVVRSLTAGMTGDIVVWLRGGTYELDSMLVFDERDSGLNGYNVIYTNYPGEAPVISGGKELTGWTLWQDGIYRTQCGDMEFRQLYVNDEKAIRARTPNGTANASNKENDHLRIVGDLNPEAGIRPSHPGGNWNTDGSQTIRIKSGDFDTGWNNYENGKIEIHIQQYWAGTIMRVKEVQSSGEFAALTVNEYERPLIFNRNWPWKSPEQAFHFENSLDFLDAEGEWYLDSSVSPRYVYYKPRAGENMAQANVTAPAVETLVSVKGSDLDNKVSHIAFQGITIKHSNWTRPTDFGYLGVQQQQYTVPGGDHTERPPAAFLIENARYISVTRSVFTDLGSAGLDVHTGTDNILIQGNLFYNIAGNGVQLGKFSDSSYSIATVYNPADTRVYCDSVAVTDNHIYECGQVYLDGCGVSAGYVRNTVIAHNEIHNLPYTGISAGWGWNSNPCVMTNNRIEYNHIYRVIGLMGDGGGIYTLGNMGPWTAANPQFTTSIAYNHIHDLERSAAATYPITQRQRTYPVAGIYLDEGSSGMIVQENCVYNIPLNATGQDAWRINYNNSASRNQAQNNPNNDGSALANRIIAEAGLGDAYEDLMGDVVVPGVAAPVWPEDSKLTAVGGDNRIVLSWPVVSGAAGYRIYQGAELIGEVDGETNSFEATGLNPNTTYKFAVKAGNALDAWTLDGPAVTATAGGSETLYQLAQEIANTKQLLANAPIGTGLGQYPLWAKEYVELAIGGAEALIGTGADDSALVAALDKLTAAVAVFMETKIVTQTGGDPTNVALKKPVTIWNASDFGGIFVPTMAVDGITDMGNGWDSPASGAGQNGVWLQVDLRDAANGIDAFVISGVEIDDRPNDPNGAWGGTRRDFEIRASNDVDFETYVVLGSQGSTPWPQGEMWSCDVEDDTPYRYVRYIKLKEYSFLAEMRVFGAPPAAAEPEFHSISGFVRDETGQPIDGATVSLYAHGNPDVVLDTAETGAGGDYAFDEVQPSGKYLVKAEKEGYENQTLIVYVPLADVSDANLTLSGETQFRIETPVFKNAAGTVVDRLIPGSELVSSVTITNRYAQPGEACFILALYDAEGNMKSIVFVEGQVKASATLAFSAGIRIPADAKGYYVKAFVWNSISGMQPLSNTVTLQ